VLLRFRLPGVFLLPENGISEADAGDEHGQRQQSTCCAERRSVRPARPNRGRSLWQHGPSSSKESKQTLETTRRRIALLGDVSAKRFTNASLSETLRIHEMYPWNY